MIRSFKEKRYVNGSGGGSGSAAKCDMNVTPMIDVLLVLLIIFMVIAPITPKGLEAMVPQPAPPNQKNDDVEPAHGGRLDQ